MNYDFEKIIIIIIYGYLPPPPKVGPVYLSVYEHDISKCCGRVMTKLGGREQADSILVQVQIQIRPIGEIQNVNCSALAGTYAFYRVPI